VGALARRSTMASSTCFGRRATGVGPDVHADLAWRAGRVRRARSTGILDAINAAHIDAVADIGCCQGADPTVRVPQRHRRLNPDTGTATGDCRRTRRRSTPRMLVNVDQARAYAQLKSWKILRKTRSSPSQATTLAKAVQVLILAG
jgi:hypothetical protein